MKNSEALYHYLDTHIHTVERQAVVGWCTGSDIIPWDQFCEIISRNVAKIRPLAVDDPWQSLSLGEIKRWWPTQYVS